MMPRPYFTRAQNLAQAKAPKNAAPAYTGHWLSSVSTKALVAIPIATRAVKSCPRIARTSGA